MDSRIVPALRTRYPEFSGARLKRAVLEGQVTVDGAVVNDPGALVPGGAEVRWDRDRRIERRVATALKVLYEDDDAIAVFKPSGLLTHPTEAKEKDTLLARVSTYVQKRHGGGERTYVSIVHRLDKETSGILVFARSRRGLIGMQAQLRAHTMDRRYRAVVEGDLTGNAGTFDKDLVAEPGERRRGVVKPGETGLKAITEWTVLERFGIATLVEARLKTGRTHQIRIHFANAGHVLVGDSVYRDRKAKPFPVPFPRQALHAGHLGWKTEEGKAVSLDADPPGDFLKLLDELRKKSKKKK
jgi:23S rRNA pseudouridine1911/1915/1917 synthase